MAILPNYKDTLHNFSEDGKTFWMKGSQKATYDPSDPHDFTQEYTYV